MTSIAHGSDTGLRRALILTRLQTDLTVARAANFLLAEIPLVFRRHFGPDPRPGVVGM